jgi:hypothetical protein
MKKQLLPGLILALLAPAASAQAAGSARALAAVC